MRWERAPSKLWVLEWQGDEIPLVQVQAMGFPGQGLQRTPLNRDSRGILKQGGSPREPPGTSPVPSLGPG